MRKHKRIWLAALLVAVLGGAAWQIWRTREPFYRGEPLSFWLDAWRYTRYGRKPMVSREAAEEAVRSMGTNVIPTLLRLLKTRDQDLALRDKVLAFAGRQPWIPIHPPTAEDRRNEAVFGFHALAEEAKPAVPALLNVLAGEKDAWVRSSSILALGQLGAAAEPAIPALIQHLTNDPDGWMRTC